jgi:uncharacterized protein
MKRLFMVVALCGVCARAFALQAAVPAYTNAHVLTGLHRGWTAPRAGTFAQAAAGLTQALQAQCTGTNSPAALNTSRNQWQATARAWDALSAVAVGPLLERRSQRAIDFAPARPALIEKAIAAQPANATDMERIGTPAKGLYALEWLLWTKPVKPNTTSCAYAVQVAAEIEHEAQALQTAFTMLASNPWTDTAQTQAAMSELVNQWVGAIERLQWAQMAKPLKAAQGRSIEWPRGASNSTAQSWAVQWQAIQTLGNAQPGITPPAPGQGVVPLALYLRGKGQNAPADALASASARVAQRIQQLSANTRINTKQVQATADALRALKLLAENTIAPALNVTIGFSDSDGD